MKKHTLSISIIALGILVAALHLVALAQYLYWVYAWYDIMMHFLGGLLVGLFASWLYVYFWKDRLLNDTNYNTLFNVIIFTLIVGLIWETFEVLFGITFSTEAEYIADTIIDFIMNTIGAITGYFIAKRVVGNENNG